MYMNTYFKIALMAYRTKIIDQRLAITFGGEPYNKSISKE